MSDEHEVRLPVIRYDPTIQFEEPEGYIPDFVELGDGRVIDSNRLYWLCDALLQEHPEAERLRSVWETQPGLDLEPLPAGMVLVTLRATGEKVGLFDARWLDA